MFIGRKAQLERLQQALHIAASGHVQIVFIAGEAGSGKTSLADEFIREHAAQDPELIVATGQCNAQTGAGDPYLPFRQVLNSLTSDAETGRNPVERDQAQRAAALREFVRVSTQTLIQIGPDLIGIFVPGGSLLARLPTLLATNSKLADKIADRVGPKQGKSASKADPALDQERIFEQYGAVLKALCAKRTLIIMLDDLQWADSGSLNLLFHIARQLQESRLLLIGTYRPDDVSLGREGERHPLEPVLNELKRYYGEVVIDLSRPPVQDARDFVNALVDSEPNRLDAAFRDHLFRQTEGHALYTVELMRNLQERGDLVRDEQGRWVQGPSLDWKSLPARVEGVIGERVARLPAALHETLTTASVMGYEFAAQVVARVKNQPERELVRDLSRELERRYRLVFEQPETRLGAQVLSPYRFSHALVHQYLYDELGAAERRLLHADIAATLEALAGSAADEIALQLACHYDEARDSPKAAHYWTVAGEAAFASYAHPEAISAYSRALELAPDAQLTPAQLRRLYARRGRAMELIGQFEQAIRNYDDLLAAAQLLRDRPMELDARVAASTLYSTPTAVVDPVRGRQLSEETLKLAEELGDQAVQARVLWNLLLVNLQDSNPQAAIEYGERSLALARALGLPEQTAYTLSDLGWAYNVACRFDEAEARLSEAAGLWHELDNMPLLTNNLNTRMHSLYWSGKNEKALELAAESLEISRTTHNIWNMSGTLHLQGLIHLEFGQTAEALDELRSSSELAVEANAPVLASWYRADLIAAHTALGNLQEAGELYAKRHVPDAQVAMSLLRTPTLVGYARYEIASGQLDTAAATLAACHASGAVWDYVLGLGQASLALACNDAAQAIAVAVPLADRARGARVGEYLPEMLLLLGMAHAQQGESEQARAALEEALVAAQAIGSVRLAARITGVMV